MGKHLENPREYILIRAEELTRTVGLVGLNMRELAKVCGLAVGTVYNYFPTKGDLQMEIVRRFWEGLPSHMERSAQGEKSFLERLEIHYQQLYSYLELFRADWLRQLTALPAAQRDVGKMREAEFFDVLRQLVAKAIEEDPQLSKARWEEPITRERVVDFTFSQMLSMLRRGEENPAFLLAVLKRILPAQGLCD